MDEDELFDVLTNIDSAAVPDKAERFESEAQRLEPGEHGRASLLIASGEHWQMRGEFDKAQESFEAALADGGESAADPEVALFGLAMERAGRRREQPGTSRHSRLGGRGAADLGQLPGCRRASTRSTASSAEAHRWLTMPLTYADADDEDLDYLLLASRLRVREALGLPRDRFDQRAFEERELHRARLD